MVGGRPGRRVIQDSDLQDEHNGEATNIPSNKQASNPSLHAQRDFCETSITAAAASYVRLEEVELQGFKSYNQSINIGPLSQFTCIVGPNGCGKSVVGEAVSFALGGNARMMRAKSLATLVNTSAIQAAANAAAQVFVTFRIPDEHGTLSVRRSVSSKQSSSQLRRGSSGSWSPVSQGELRKALMQHGIMTDVVDRFIVTQNRQAVAVHDPIELLRYMEQLIGTGDYADRISSKAAEISTCSDECGSLADEIDTLYQKRRKLAPEVTKWRRYEADMKAFQGRKHAFLNDRRTSLEAELLELQSKVGPEAGAVEACREAEEKLRMAVAEKERERDSLQRSAKQIQALHRKQTQKVESLKVEEARVAVHLKAAADARAREKAQRSRWAKRRQQLQDNHGALRNRLKTLEAKQATLCTAELDAKAELDSLTAAVDGCTMEEVRDQLEAAQAKLQKAQALLKAADTAESTRRVRLQETEQRVQQLEAEAAAAARAAQDQDAQEAKEQAQVVELRQQSEQAAATSQAEEHRLRKLQTELMRVQAELSSLQEMVHQASPANASSAMQGSALDALVSSFTMLSREGKLQHGGTFYGRLNTLFRVRSPSVVPAANAVLSELTNLATCLIVSDRQLAGHVLSCLQQQRAGMATCKIVSELAKQSGRSSMDSVLNATSDLTPLLLHLEVTPAAPEVQCVLNSMLASWFLAKDRQSAVKAVEADKRSQGRKFAPRNIVTREGELFKADGEVVAGGTVRKQSSSYALTTEFAMADASSSPAENNQSAEETAALQAKSTQLQERCEQLQKQVMEAEVQLQKAKAQERSSTRAMDRLQRSMAARKAKDAKTNTGSSTGATQRHMQAAQEAAQALRGQALDPDRRAELEQDVQRMHGEYAQLRSLADGGGELLAAEQRLHSLQQQSRELAAELIKAQEEFTQTQRQLAQLLEGPQPPDKSARTEMAELKAKSSELAGQIQAVEAAQQATAKQQQEVQDQLAAAKSDISSTSRALTAAKKRTAKAAEAYERLTGRVTAQQAHLEKIIAALANLPAPASRNAADAQPPSSRSRRSKRQRTAGAIPSTPADQDQGEEEDGIAGASDSESEHDVPQHDMARGRGPAKSSSESWATVAQELAEQEEALEALRHSIDSGALEADLAALVRLEAATRQLAAAEQALSEYVMLWQNAERHVIGEDALLSVQA